MESLKCEKSLMIKGRCCPICSDELSSGAVCLHNENIYGLNEEFHDGPCRNCSCRVGRGGFGHLECLELQCPTCKNPVPIPGDSCCPSCRDSELYSFEGQTETIFGDVRNRTEISNINHLVMYAGFGLTAGVILIVFCFILTLFVLKHKREKLHRNRSRNFNLASAKQKPEVSQPHIHTASRPLIAKQRHTSECESHQSDIANVSLLSSTSETSTTPSTSLTGTSCSGKSNSLGREFQSKTWVVRSSFCMNVKQTCSSTHSCEILIEVFFAFLPYLLYYL